MAIVRPEQAGDSAAIRAVLAECFPSTAEADLVDRLRDAGHLTVSLVAETDGRVVGHVAFSPVVAGGGAGATGLAPLAVLPSHRRQGIASSLVAAGLGACASLGYGWAVVLGDPRFYARFGFEPAADFGLMDEYDGGPAFQVVELVAGSVPVGVGVVRYGPEFALLTKGGPEVQDSCARLWGEFLDAGSPAAQAAAASSYTSWQFGYGVEQGDRLMALVLSGRKRATTGALWAYDHEGDAVPKPGEFSVVTDGSGVARCVIMTTCVEIVPLESVDEEFAFVEGEGDRSLAYWRDAHWSYFTRELETMGRVATWDMPVVCERFDVVFPVSGEQPE